MAVVKINQQLAYDRCHALGHAWFPIDAAKPPQFGYYFWMKCESCDTVRKDIVDRAGQLLARSYDYPDDYRDSEHWERSDYRIRYMSKIGLTTRGKPAGVDKDWTDGSERTEDRDVG